MDKKPRLVGAAALSITALGMALTGAAAREMIAAAGVRPTHVKPAAGDLIANVSAGFRQDTAGNAEAFFKPDISIRGADVFIKPGPSPDRVEVIIHDDQGTRKQFFSGIDLEGAKGVFTNVESRQGEFFFKPSPGPRPGLEAFFRASGKGTHVTVTEVKAFDDPSATVDGGF